MLRRFLLPASAGLFLFVPLSGASSAQEASPAPSLIPQDSVQFVLQRFQSLQQQVGGLQQQVMDASPDLQEYQATVSGLVEAAVYEIDPALQTDMETRMPALQQEAQAAQASGDTATLQTLEQEYVALRTRAEEAEAAALEQPEIQSQVEAFQEALRAEMRAVDPEVEAMVEELERLAARLEATLGGG